MHVLLLLPISWYTQALSISPTMLKVDKKAWADICTDKNMKQDYLMF